MCRLRGRRDVSVDRAGVSVWPGDVLRPCPSAAPAGAPRWSSSCVLVCSSVPLEFLPFDLGGELCIGAEASLFPSPP